MAKQLNGPRTGEVEDGDFIEGKHDDITALQGDIDAEVSRITSEFGADPNAADFKIKYYKIVPKTGKRDWLFDIQPSELPVMAKLRDEYGTGDYESHIYKNGKLNRKFSFGILAPSLPKFQQPAPQTDMSGILRAMAEQQDRQFNQLKEIMIQVARPAAPPVDIVQMMTAMVSMMVQMKTLAAPPDTGSGEKAIEMLLKGLEMGKDLGSDKPTGIMDIMGTVVKEALPALSHMAASAANQQPRPQAPANTSIQSRPQPQPQIQGNQMGMQEMVMKKYLEQLCVKAAEGRDPSLYAELILDNVPVNVLTGFLNNPDPISQMVALYPPASGYRPWLTQMMNEIRDMLTDSDPEDLTSGGESIHTGQHVPEQSSDSTAKPVNGNPGRGGRDSGDPETDGGAG